MSMEVTAINFTNSKGKIYFLHSKQIILRGNRPQQIYYFGKEAGPLTINAMPAGFEIAEGKSGLPFVRRIKPI